MGEYSWNDTPGAPLASRKESIDFSGPRRVKEIRAVYDEEYAYRTDGNGQGSFQAGFEDSTISEDGKVVSLKRRGGWNRIVRVYPEMEPAPPPTGGQAMGAIYEVDFTTLPTQVIGAAGSYTVDGKTWWAKGSLTYPGVVQTSGVLNGSGLYIGTNTGADLPQGSQNIRGRMLVLPLSELDDFNPQAPLIVRAKFSLPGWGPSRGAFVGLVDTPADGNAYLIADQSKQVLCGTPDGNPAASLLTFRGTAGPSGAAAGQASVGVDARLVGCMRLMPKYADLCSQNWDGVGAIPDVNDVIPQQQGLSQYATNTPANPCVAMILRNNFGAPFTAYMTHLSIHQPKVAV
jgi:hypothetical protein